MEKEYLIMDDGGSSAWDKITPEMSAVYESVRKEILQLIFQENEAGKS